MGKLSLKGKKSSKVNAYLKKNRTASTVAIIILLFMTAFSLYISFRRKWK